MSYQQVVLRDDPVSYWPLNGMSTLRTYQELLDEYANYQVYLNSESSYSQDAGSVYFEDVTPKSSHGAIAFGNELPVFTDVLTLNSVDYDGSYINGCKIKDTSIIRIFDVYNFFDKNYEGGIFSAEFWVYFNEAPTTNVNLLSVTNGSSIIAQVYASGDTIYFNVNGSNQSYTTKKQIYSWDKKMHVYVTYKEYSIEIAINGIFDEIVSIPKDFKLYTTDNTYVKYKVGPAQSGKSFIINDLAFYNKSLSLNEIRYHMIWANKNSRPEIFAQQGSAYHFNILPKNEMVHSERKFSSTTDYDQGLYSGLISNSNGLTFQQTTSAASATGTWIYNYPIVQYMNFAGASISWDTASTQSSTIYSDYVSVYASYNNGSSWYQVYNNEIIPYFLSVASDITSSQLLIKVVLFSTDTSQTIQPRLDNLSITLYKSLNISADAGGFVLSPLANTTYMIKENDDNILEREKNFGIYFVNQTPGTGKPGTAIINSVNSTEYKTVEFWFQYESCQSNTQGAVLDTNTVGGVDLYMDTATNTLKSNLGANGSMYVNGILQSSGTYPITPKERYFITLIYNTSTTNQIYINGELNNSMIPLQAMYGFITLFPNALTLAEIQSRYLSYLSVKYSTLKDGLTSLGSISEYSATNSSAINGGQPVIAYEHIY